MSEFSELQLQLETGSTNEERESWAVTDGGTLHHHKEGISISEMGLRNGKSEFYVDPCHIQVELDPANQLGRGAGGTVYRAVHRPTNTALAVKVVPGMDKEKRSQLMNDLRTLLRIPKSSFLIQLYAVYSREGCVHVALEYMDYGSLADVKKRVHMVPEHILALIIVQILEGLKTLHLSYVLHRDVKLPNILVNSCGMVKVTDFGISKTLDDSVCDTFVGTMSILSPERMLGEDYSFPADIWSMGLCVYELAAGVYPYNNKTSLPAIFDNLCNKPEPRLPPGRFSPALCDFVACCLQRKPEHRASVIQLQAGDFIMMNMLRVSQQELITWLDRLMRGPEP